MFSLVAALACLTTDSAAPGDSPPIGGQDTGSVQDTQVVDTGPILEPSFEQDVQPILQSVCKGCHTPNFDYADLDLSMGTSSLVGVYAKQAPELLRVSPAELSDSYLWHKLQGTHRQVGGSGDAMPAAGREISERDLQTIKRWIEQGARP